MTEIKNNNRSWTEYFRIIAPFLLLLLTWIGSGINTNLSRLDAKIDNLDTKIFRHLTNEEIHIARNAVVDKNTFEIYQSMRDKQMCDLKEGINRIESLLMKHMEKK